MNEFLQLVADLSPHDKAALGLIFGSAFGGSILGGLMAVVAFRARR